MEGNNKEMREALENIKQEDETTCEYMNYPVAGAPGEVLASSTHIARRSHTCNYCHAPIEKGERYCRSVGKFDGESYTWKAHIHCDRVARAIWDWVDPDGGMMDDFTFQECSKQVMHDFFCKDNCNQWDDEDGCMEGGWPDCLRKFSEYMKTHRLAYVMKPSGIRVWEMVKKEGDAK